MKAISVSELKAHLCRYLRMAARNECIVVHDRDEPIAQLTVPEPAASSWRERLERQGKLRRGTQDWKKLEISRIEAPIDIQESLQAVRGLTVFGVS